MDKKLISNYIYSVMYQMLLVIMPFITTPYLTRVVGPTALSLNTWTANLVQWFVLFGQMGVTTYGNREIAKVRDDKKLMSKTFFEIFAMQLISLFTAAIVFFLFIQTQDASVRLILLLQSVTLLSVCLDITWFFYGVEDFKKASIRNMIVKILGVALIFTFVKSAADIKKFIMINTWVGVFGQMIMWAQLKQYVSFEKINLKGVLRHFKPNFSLFIPQIAISVYSILDITMLGYLGPVMEEVNFYEQAQKFVKMFLFFVTSIGAVMLPRVTNVYHKGDVKQVNAYLAKTVRFALYMSIPMIFGINGMIQNFIDWFLPETYSVVGTLIKCTSPIILFISLSNVFGTQFMVPTGDVKHYTISVVFAAFLNFFINLTLMPSLGAYGAIIGSVSAEASVTLIQYYFVKGKIDIGLTVREVATILIASACMLPVIIVVGKFLGANFISNILQIGAGVIVYIIVLLILKAPFFMEILHSLRNRGVKNA